MKHTFLALAVAGVLATGMVGAQAQTAAKKPAAAKKAPVKKAPAKKAPAKKAPAKKTPAPRAAAPAPAVQPQIPAFVPGATGEFPVFTGEFKCNEGMLSLLPQGDDFALKVPSGRTYVMRRVPTTTGVVRLEGNAGKAYWLQSGNKSMLIDTASGGRVADGCRNALQQAREDDLKNNPANLLN